MDRAPYLPCKILHKYHLQFLSEWLWYPQQIKTIGYETVRLVVVVVVVVVGGAEGGGGGWQT